MEAYKDILITIDFHDYNDMMSKYHGIVFGQRDCHIGLRHADKYLLPTYPKKIKLREPLIVYAAFPPNRSIHLLGKQPEDNPDWIKKHVGTYMSSPLSLFFVTHANFARDAGLDIKTPRVRNCVDIIADTIAQIDIHTRCRSPFGFYQELSTHPMRVG